MEKKVEKDAQLYGEKAGAVFDDAVCPARPFDSPVTKAYFEQMKQAKDATHKVDAKLENYRSATEKKLDEARRETGKTLTNAIDKFDSSVEKGAAQSKSWIGSWFGGK